MGTCILHIYHSYLSVVILEVQLQHKILFCQCVGLVHTVWVLYFLIPGTIYIYVHKEITGTILISNLRPFEIYINSYQTFDTKINMCATVHISDYCHTIMKVPIKYTYQFRGHFPFPLWDIFSMLTFYTARWITYFCFFQVCSLLKISWSLTNYFGLKTTQFNFT